jgi:Co/Zn/Cd efflux system component
VISNVGVLIAAGAVAALSSPWPDIIIGAAMAAVVLRSAVRVLGAALPQLKTKGA